MRGRKTVRYWHMWSGEWGEVVQTIIDEFNESQSRYEVVPLIIPGSVGESKFLMGTVGGDPPDVMTHWAQVIPTWGSQGLLLPLETLMSRMEWEDFKATSYPVSLTTGMLGESLYGMTIGLNAFGLYYIPQHFIEAGLDPENFPKSLEELCTISELLHRKDRSNNYTRIGYVPSNFLNLSQVFGGGLYDFEKSELTLNSEENVRAMDFIVEERKKVGFDAVNRFFSGLDSASFTGGWPFIGGALSCTFDGQWRVEQIRKFAPDLEYKTIPLPPPQGGRPLAGVTNGNFMIIPKTAKEVEGAWEFVRFWSGLAGSEQAASLYTRGGWLPLNNRIAEAPDYQKYLRENPEFGTFVKVLASQDLVGNPPVPTQTFIMDRANRSEDFAIRGTWSPRQAVEELEKAVVEEQERRRRLGYAV